MPPTFVPDSLDPNLATQPPGNAVDTRMPASSAAPLPDERPALQVSELAARPFGRYEILAEVGRGGMGVVFKARDSSVGRVVALKLLLMGGHSGPKELGRFQAEIEATARLEHRNIVRVYEVGEIDGCAYYTMEYIDGPNLEEQLGSGPVPSRQAARYVRAVAQAIHHAHALGILHRDLKPSNVLLDASGEPRVADFGLAKCLGSGVNRTQTGDIVGTACYMAPEQAVGKNRELGPPVDVYGLGALLYQLLTGRPPFRGDSPLETLRQVVECEPAPPRLLNPKVDRDLETICLRCLEKNPCDRYASADDLAEDIRRYLDGELVHARSVNLLARLSKALGHSHHDIEFSTWGTRILLLGGIVLAAQLLIFWFALQPSAHFRVCVVGTRLVQFLLMGFVVAAPRSRAIVPRTPAEKELWAIWLGFLAACILSALLGKTGIGPQTPEDEFAAYPAWSLLGGLAFIVMGSNYWGRCYLFGLAFFLLAPVMQFSGAWAPLQFGLVWGSILATIGWHLRHLGKAD